MGPWHIVMCLSACFYPYCSAGLKHSWHCCPWVGSGFLYFLFKSLLLDWFGLSPPPKAAFIPWSYSDWKALTAVILAVRPWSDQPTSPLSAVGAGYRITRLPPVALTDYHLQAALGHLVRSPRSSHGVSRLIMSPPPTPRHSPPSPRLSRWRKRRKRRRWRRSLQTWRRATGGGSTRCWRGCGAWSSATSSSSCRPSSAPTPKRPSSASFRRYVTKRRKWWNHVSVVILIFGDSYL